MTHLLYLAGSILSSTIIVLLFKVFEQKQINSFQAIVVNYFVCVATGSLLIGEVPIKADFWKADWFPYALGLGVLFISTFYFVALTVQHFGVAVAIVIQKMSIILTVIFAIWMYDETVNALKIAGIILALLAVLLVNRRDTANKNEANWSWWMLLLPAYVFICCGGAESLLQYVKMSILGDEGGIRFSIFLFGAAGTIGAVIMLGSILLGKAKFSVKTLFAGLALGVPNYFSLHFLLKILDGKWEGSVIFPVNNIGIIILSSLLAWIIFTERLSKINLFGIGLAIFSIVLIALSS